MKHGDKARIAKHTGLSKGFISLYLNGRKNASWKNIEKIEQAIIDLGIDFDFQDFHEEIQEAYDRDDIYNNLPYGAIALLSRKTRVSFQTVVHVLRGKSKDKYGVIKKAELLAAINIWKTRFCKHKSQL